MTLTLLCLPESPPEQHVPSSVAVTDRVAGSSSSANAWFTLNAPVLASNMNLPDSRFPSETVICTLNSEHYLFHRVKVEYHANENPLNNSEKIEYVGQRLMYPIIKKPLPC